ncbi:tRNA pseudouridine(55) synthase TruB [Clostridium massiliamazoniense]|uniref:tRNA pseudouridine(55) synthase TruB n=1 Tax=Clostridium massiliamazoniense TaxID=1347366 RepID=UPI0006D7D74F|nr:tRNA pseudouridine(55) synthase TruB [Clostridium massiliamazoniense]
MNGIINVCKNTGQSSFDVVAKIRRYAKEKKVGHTGTLDPEASGVLPVCLGKATKIIEYIMENKKVYRVTFKLGVITTTYDLEGEVIKENSIENVKEEDIIKTIGEFKGEIEQVPPMYSALKKDGVRLYELARKGIEVEREARKITINSIENIEINLPYITMDVSCSKGTYIRSLCYDIGEKLKVGATMTALVRIANGEFKIENSVNIKDLNEENVEEYILTLEDALVDFPKFEVDDNFKKLLINGVCVGNNKIYKGKKLEVEKLYRVYDEKNNLLGLGKRTEKGFKIEKMLI